MIPFLMLSDRLECGIIPPSYSSDAKGSFIIIVASESMNLKERMEHQNRNNSSMLNSSAFDFSKLNKEDQVYEKSRRECE